jgi:hypothetical protein
MQAICTRYTGATNTRGSRIIASTEGGSRVSVPYPHELSGEAVHRVAAEALKKKLGWTGRLVGGAVKHGYCFVFVGGDRAIYKKRKR